MKTIKASEFKAKCLALMDEVARTGEPIVITKNGEPVSQLAPYRRRLESLFGLHRDAVRIEGDIVRPLDVDWESER
jgi:prevent-host-death family protein